MLPAAGLSDQVTPVPAGKLRTENCWAFPGDTVAVEGLTLGAGGGEANSVKLALPRTVSVEEFSAVTVTVSCDATVLGAVNKPAAVMLPAAGLSDQVTPVPAGKLKIGR